MARTPGWSICLLVLLLLPRDSLQGRHQRKLLDKLLKNYNTLERPVLNDSDPLTVNLGVTLQQIIDVDEKNQILTTNIWVRMIWTDEYLSWNESEFGGLNQIRLDPKRIWVPDILMYNSADERFDGTYPTKVVVSSSGSCLYLPPGIFKSSCKIDVTYFPFDEQRCNMKFGSWSHSGFQVDLQMVNRSGGADLTPYMPNGEWDLLGMPAKRSEFKYDCCPEPYPDITFTVNIRRRTLFYGTNLLVPCVLISTLTLLVFTMPPESGEKLSLGITILLSLTVFLLLVAEAMPPTSDVVPLIGKYFATTLCMVAGSVVLTVLTLNFHHRSPETSRMSRATRKVLLEWLPRLLCMPSRREDKSEGARDRVRETLRTDNISMNSFKTLDELSSHNLLASLERREVGHDFPLQAGQHDFPPGLSNDLSPRLPRNFPTALPATGFNIPVSATADETGLQYTRAAARTSAETQQILKELRYIANHFRDKNEDDKAANEWRYAAMTVDRLCLFIFAIFTMVTTGTILLSAPHILEQVRDFFVGLAGKGAG
ncbi:neuronal acetylcholine receptor subunit alpha-7-like [Branchiostoma floridae x Branchiostoma japonicum]